MSNGKKLLASARPPFSRVCNGVLKSLRKLSLILLTESMPGSKTSAILWFLSRSGDIYRWQMLGSYSIKEVQPVMVPELSYDGMSVSDGMMAMRVYHEMCKTEDPAKVAKLRQGLLEYCRLDTLAMVKILGELNGK